MSEFDLKTTFDDYFDHLCGIAKETLIETGGHGSILLVTEGTRATLYDVSSFYVESNPAALNTALSERYQGEANWFIQVAEAWAGKPGAAALRPSENPERIEVLMISGVRRDGERRQRMYEIVRNEAQDVVDAKLHMEPSKFLSVLEVPLFGGATREMKGARLVVDPDPSASS